MSTVAITAWISRLQASPPSRTIRSNVFRIGGAFVSFLGVLMLLGSAGLSAQNVTIQYVQGPVEQRINNGWTPVSIGEAITDSSLVCLGNGALMSFSFAGQYITLHDPGSYSLREVLGVSKILHSPVAFSVLKSSLGALLANSTVQPTSVLGVRGLNENPLQGKALKYYEAATVSIRNYAYRIAEHQIKEALVAADPRAAPYLLYYLSYTYSLAGNTERALKIADEIRPEPSDRWAAELILLKAQLLLEQMAFRSEVRWLRENAGVATEEASSAPVYLFFLGMGYRGLGNLRYSNKYLLRAAAMDTGGRIATLVASITGNKTGEQPPAWILQPPSHRRYFVGIGGAPETGDPSYDAEAAERNAREALVAAIRRSLTNHSEVTLRDNSEGDPVGQITVLVNGALDLRLRGVTLAGQYHSARLGYWLYYRLPRKALSPTATFSSAVGQLTRRLSSPLPVALRGFTDAQTGLSSPFSLFLQDQVLLSLLKQKGFRIAENPVAGLRGGLPARMANDIPASVYPAMTARPGVVLAGTYSHSPGGRDVSVSLRLSSARHDRTLALTSFAIPVSALPSGVPLRPANYAAALRLERLLFPGPKDLTKSTRAPLQVYVTTGHGNAAVYLDGEPLTIRFSATRDCYVRVFHIGANGNTTILYPNSFAGEEPIRGGTVYRIPGSRKPFELRLDRPFGAEFIEVIASTTPFSHNESAFADLGTASRALLRQLLARARGIAAREASAIVSYTIVRR